MWVWHRNLRLASHLLKPSGTGSKRGPSRTGIGLPLMSCLAAGGSMSRCGWCCFTSFFCKLTFF